MLTVEQAARVVAGHDKPKAKRKSAAKRKKTRRVDGNPEPLFRLGDRVQQKDNPSMVGVVSFVAGYDDFLKQYRYKVLAPDGSRIHWNEGGMKKMPKAPKAKVERNSGTQFSPGERVKHKESWVKSLERKHGKPFPFVRAMRGQVVSVAGDSRSPSSIAVLWDGSASPDVVTAVKTLQVLTMQDLAGNDFREMRGYSPRTGRFSDLTPKVKMEIERVRLDRQGYTSRGEYYGVGAPLFRASYEDLVAGPLYFETRAENASAARKMASEYFSRAYLPGRY